MATRASERPITPEEFLEIDFGPNLKAELDRGTIRMMAGGTYAHSVVQGNVLAFLHTRLRGSGCRPHASDMAVKTRSGSVRYPDVSIDCGSPAEHARDKALVDPRVVIEVLSPSTRAEDLGVKLADYRTVPGIHTIAFIDPDEQTIAVTRRTDRGGWTDVIFSADSDLEIVAMDLTVPLAEVFALD
jgi:Uma2 family endonuclease